MSPGELIFLHDAVPEDWHTVEVFILGERDRVPTVRHHSSRCLLRLGELRVLHVFETRFAEQRPCSLEILVLVLGCKDEILRSAGGVQHIDEGQVGHGDGVRIVRRKRDCVFGGLGVGLAVARRGLLLRRRGFVHGGVWVR